VGGDYGAIEVAVGGDWVLESLGEPWWLL